jgi:uncharacterized membrane protein YeaQ/YmgE (transglycosylase-associated protein family)
MLNFIAWIVAGGALGLVVSRVVRGGMADAMLNVLAGVVGGFVGGLAVRSLLALLDPEMAHLSLWALAAAVTGASLLLAVVNVPVRTVATVRQPVEQRQTD